MSMNQQIHRHNPCGNKNIFLRLLIFLVQPKKAYCHIDDTGICGECGIPIKAPHPYYHFALKLSYTVCGFLSVILRRLLLPNQTSFVVPFLFTLGTVIVFHWVITAIVLAFCEWIPYDLEYHDVDKESVCVQKNFVSKLRFTGFGLGLALFTIILHMTL